MDNDNQNHVSPADEQPNLVSPTREFIYYSLTYGLRTGEMPTEQKSFAHAAYSYSDLEYIARKRGFVVKKLIGLGLKYKQKIMQYPAIYKMALRLKKLVIFTLHPNRKTRAV